MQNASFVILYVDSPTASCRFYRALLGAEPVEASPTFALFALKSGIMLGLWSRHTVEPGAEAAGGGGELGMPVGHADQVDAIHREWKERGITILQEPVDLDFGRTFVATDPHGHRLRVFSPTEA